MADSDSILTSIKKALGLDAEYDAFDMEIIMHINSTFSTLQQLGVGPVDGFAINDDSETWAFYMGSNKALASVRTYVFIKVKLIFDPPATSYVQTAFQEQAKEIEWRLNVHVETPS